VLPVAGPEGVSDALLAEEELDMLFVLARIDFGWMNVECLTLLRILLNVLRTIEDQRWGGKRKV
jgi:hypothetical protein